MYSKFADRQSTAIGVRSFYSAASIFGANDCHAIHLYQHTLHSSLKNKKWKEITKGDV